MFSIKEREPNLIQRLSLLLNARSSDYNLDRTLTATTTSYDQYNFNETIFLLAYPKSKNNVVTQHVRDLKLPATGRNDNTSMQYKLIFTAVKMTIFN